MTQYKKLKLYVNDGTENTKTNEISFKQKPFFKEILEPSINFGAEANGSKFRENFPRGMNCSLIVKTMQKPRKRKHINFFSKV